MALFFPLISGPATSGVLLPYVRTAEGADMTQPFDTDDDQELSPGDLRRQLEDALAKAKAAEDEIKERDSKLTELQKNEAFRKAEIPEDAEFFREHFDPAKVDFDPERIKAEAIKAKVLEPPPPDTPPAELEAHQAMANASAGAALPGVHDPNAEELAELERIAQANPAFAAQNIAQHLRSRGRQVDTGPVTQVPGAQVGGVESV